MLLIQYVKYLFIQIMRVCKVPLLVRKYNLYRKPFWSALDHYEYNFGLEPGTTKILGPISWYREEKERQYWVSVARSRRKEKVSSNTRSFKLTITWPKTPFFSYLKYLKANHMTYSTYLTEETERQRWIEAARARRKLGVLMPHSVELRTFINRYHY